MSIYTEESEKRSKEQAERRGKPIRLYSCAYCHRGLEAGEKCPECSKPVVVAECWTCWECGKRNPDHWGHSCYEHRKPLPLTALDMELEAISPRHKGHYVRPVTVTRDK